MEDNIVVVATGGKGGEVFTRSGDVSSVEFESYRTLCAKERNRDR